MTNSAAEGNLFQVLFNALPLPLFRVNQEVEILDLNNDDQQLWSSAESYFARFLKVDFTHSICPDCTQLLYPDFYPKGKR